MAKKQFSGFSKDSRVSKELEVTLTEVCNPLGNKTMLSEKNHTSIFTYKRTVHTLDKSAFSY